MAARADRPRRRGGDVRRAAELTDLPEHGSKPIFDGYFENTLGLEHAAYERAWREFSAMPGTGGPRSGS